MLKPLRQHVLWNAFRISALVGSLLNAINQGGDMLEGHVSWPHFVLNYLVPFAVATYSGFAVYQDRPER